tara:strand:- start:1534 stop:1725 length:192 start_codon:yes stop_codon:yes gene_type:complete
MKKQKKNPQREIRKDLYMLADGISAGEEVTKDLGDKKIKEQYQKLMSEYLKLSKMIDEKYLWD